LTASPFRAASEASPTPQLAAIHAQRSTASASPRGHARQAATPTGPSAAAAGSPAFAALAATVAEAAPAPGSSGPLRTAPLRAHAPVHRSSNPLEGIGRHIPLPAQVPDWSRPIILVLFILALWGGVRSRVAALRARKLERQRVGLLRDVGAMQAALVPEVPARLGNLAVSVAYRPAEGPAAGGDFYDLFVARPGKVAVMLGDVAGHGHEALTHAALTRYTLRAYLQAGLEPRMALALAGRVLVDRTGERYATVALGVYDEHAGTLTYALAGHPPPMVLGPALGVQAHEPVTVCSSPPVGWGLPTGRRQTTISLPAGTEVCFFSDGLVEARREGQLLGREHLREILAGLGSGARAEQLLAEVRAAASGVPDDMLACILASESVASPRRVHVEELEADAHMLDRAAVRRFLRECMVPPEELTRVLQRARVIASSAGTALLRVELGSTASAVTVSSPGAIRVRARSSSTQPVADLPLAEVLAAH